jgi:rod shape-determining protein MreD
MNSKLTLRGFFMLAVSFLLALILSILPLSNAVMLFYPHWLLLIVIYWILALPHRISLGVAWLLGLILDGLYGSTFGEHALAMTVVAYLVEKFHQQIRMFPLLQQAICILVFVLIYQGLLFWIQGILGQLPNTHWFWLSAITSMIVWPWLFMLLRAWRRSAGVH